MLSTTTVPEVRKLYLIKSWEAYMLDDDEIMALLRQVGGSAWEDSVELISNITWTPSLPVRFAKKHGYTMKPMMPLLAFRQTTTFTQVSFVAPFHCLLDAPDKDTAYLNDYHFVLNDGYNDFIAAVRNWLHTRVGVKYPNQPAYGFPQDMTTSIAPVDVPEYESWAYGDKIDAYRQFIGTAHLSAKRIISNELGAQISRAYIMTIQELLGIVHRAIIGGTNQIIPMGSLTQVTGMARVGLGTHPSCTCTQICTHQSNRPGSMGCLRFSITYLDCNLSNVMAYHAQTSLYIMRRPLQI
ncbi:uncharacterized protein BDV17DRAFT_151197 [Aspergillus undulatus]|uniref:uncharacterized protein n=1 Tax=Aspergillus undulatus TaxID=1810928 RepID=UPI003CCD9CB5